MPTGSANQFPKVIFVEGAAPGTPASGIVYAYAKADGLMYSKDDAGVETLMSSGPGTGIPATIIDAAGDLIVGSAADTAARLAKGNAGAALAMSNGAVIWNAGTSFPGSPATGDRYFRTDRGIEYFYDGTRWLCICPHWAHMEPADGGSASTITASQDNYAGGGMLNGGDVYLGEFNWQINIATTNNGTNFWTWTLQKLEAGASTGTTVVAPNSTALSTGWSGGATNIAAAHTDVGALRVNLAKTLSPGGFIGWFSVSFRMIG